MQDLSLNSNLSVHLDGTNDFAVVDDRDAFEQSVMITLIELQQEAMAGQWADDTAKEKVSLAVNRVVRDHEQVDAVEQIEVTEDPTRPDTFLVEIIYTSNSTFEDNITL